MNTEQFMLELDKKTADCQGDNDSEQFCPHEDKILSMLVTDEGKYRLARKHIDEPDAYGNTLYKIYCERGMGSRIYCEEAQKTFNEAYKNIHDACNEVKPRIQPD